MKQPAKFMSMEEIVENYGVKVPENKPAPGPKPPARKQQPESVSIIGRIVHDRQPRPLFEAYWDEGKGQIMFIFPENRPEWEEDVEKKHPIKYAEQGAKAYVEGKSSQDNSYYEDQPRNDWTQGYYEAKRVAKRVHKLARKAGLIKWRSEAH